MDKHPSASLDNDQRADNRAEPDFSFTLRPQGLFVGASRVLLHSHVGTEMLRKQLFHQVGEDLARAILAQASRHGGWNDAQLLLQEHSFDSLESMVRAQYGMLRTYGYGTFEVRDLVIKKGEGEAYVRVRCTHSPEAESHRRLFGRSASPACCHLVGYSSGWSSSMTGMQLLTIETRCAARGDEHCEFETLPYADFVGPEAAFWKRAFEATSVSIAQELQKKLDTIEKQMAIIERQRQTLLQIGTPILQLAEGVLALPIIGVVDEERAGTMSERLLEAIVVNRAKGVVIDVTGVANVDARTASSLSRMAQAARLLGTRIVISGISPSVAQTLIEQAFRLSDVMTCKSLQDGMQLLKDRAARSK